MIRTRNSLKLLLILGVTLLAILLFGNTVNAATEFSDKNKDVMITLEKDLGISGTKTECINNNYEYTDGEGALGNIIKITGVNQNKLNEYAKNPKTFNANIKMKLPYNDCEKVIWIERNYDNGEVIDTDKGEATIETINGNKYVVYSRELKYNNIEHDKPVDNSIKYMSIHTGEGADISLDNNCIKLIKKDGSYEIYRTSAQIDIYSENQPFNYSFEYVNKHDQKYPVSGGLGSGPDREDKWYATEKEDVEGYFGFIGNHYLIPTNINLAEAYLKLKIDVYQGDSIQVDGLGILYYSGITEENPYDSIQGKRVPKKVYVYKNSLNNLKKLTKTVTFKAKGETGYVYTRCIHRGWTLSDNVKEETIKGKINTENKDLKFNILIDGHGNAKFKAIDIKKDDTLYIKLENGLKETITEEDTYIDLGTFDISVIEGTYDGKLNLTFDVGNQYNGKECRVGHLKNVLDYEQYIAKVENGKITITVDSLSPFMISLVEKKEDTTPSTPNTEKPITPSTTKPTKPEHKLDDTPKTGNNNIISLISLVIVTSIVGIIVLRKYSK